MKILFFKLCSKFTTSVKFWYFDSIQALLQIWVEIRTCSITSKHKTRFSLVLVDRLTIRENISVPAALTLIPLYPSTHTHPLQYRSQYTPKHPMRVKYALYTLKTHKTWLPLIYATLRNKICLFTQKSSPFISLKHPSIGYCFFPGFVSSQSSKYIKVLWLHTMCIEMRWWLFMSRSFAMLKRESLSTLYRVQSYV